VAMGGNSVPCLVPIGTIGLLSMSGRMCGAVSISTP
jgi:hypothetical protein